MGLANLAPGVLQLRVQVPAGSTGFTVRWEQAAGGALGGLLGGGGAPPVLAGLVVETEGRVHWTYVSGAADTLVAVPHDDTGAVIAFDPTAPASLATVSSPSNRGVAQGTFAVALESDPCKARTFIVNLVSTKDAVRMQNLDLVVGAPAKEVCSPPVDGSGCGGPPLPAAAPSCGCTTTSTAAPGAGLALASVLAALGLRRRRRG